VSWWTVAAIAAVCFLLRAGVPVVLGSRGLPSWLEGRLDAALPALLASLAAVQLFALRGHIGIDARAAGVGAAGVLFARCRSLPVAMVLAAGVTAAVRLLAG
jgi:branched-subunit amino acid transport protein